MTQKRHQDILRNRLDSHKRRKRRNVGDHMETLYNNKNMDKFYLKKLKQKEEINYFFYK